MANEPRWHYWTPLRIVVAILVVAALVAAGLLLGFHH
jgi:hypothetical protein